MPPQPGCIWVLVCYKCVRTVVVIVMVAVFGGWVKAYLWPEGATR